MLPSVTKAKYVKDYLIEVKFNDGTKKVIDFEPWLTGPIFRPLKSKTYFKKFFVDGPTITWPNGADIAPETLYEADAIKLGNESKLRRAGYKKKQNGSPMANIQVKNIPERLHNKLQRYAREQNSTLGEVVLEAIERDIARREWHKRFTNHPITRLRNSAAQLLRQERRVRDGDLP